MLNKLALITAVSLAALIPLAQADDLTTDEARAREIYANVISIRSARGQEKVPDVVSYLISEFKAAGFTDDDIEVTDYDAAGEHTQGLMVWYRAENPTEKPVVLLAHMDVVDALAEDWVRDPFTLTEEEGYFFGRGTADNKYGLTNLTQTLIRLKQNDWTPRRDLVLVLSGDEETGMVSTKEQAKYVAENIDPEFILNSDSGGYQLDDESKPRSYSIQGAEKTFATFEVTVTNPGGHSSRPRADNAIYELATALKEIEAYEFPTNYSDLTRAYMRSAGRKRLDGLGKAMRTFAEDPTDADAIAVLRKNPATVGTIGTTCIATMLRAGHAENALPQSATATVNCRIFPGEGVELTEARLKEVVTNDKVQFKVLGEVTESPESGIRDEVLDAVKLALADRGESDLEIIPYMSAGGTDGMHYRNLGYDTYAIGGLGAKENDTYAHGLNERVLVDQFYAGLDHWMIILDAVAGTKAAE